jgi:hypothetical protein
MVFCALVVGMFFTIQSVTGMNEGGTLFLMVIGGIIIMPVIYYATFVIVGAVTVPSTYISTCHNCGLSWYEKGANPPKRAAPNQSR